MAEAGGGGTMEAAASDGLVRPVGVAAALMGVAAEAGVVLPGVDTALLLARPTV